MDNIKMNMEHEVEISIPKILQGYVLDSLVAYSGSDDLIMHSIVHLNGLLNATFAHLTMFEDSGNARLLYRRFKQTAVDMIRNLTINLKGDSVSCTSHEALNDLMEKYRHEVKSILIRWENAIRRAWEIKF